MGGQKTPLQPQIGFGDTDAVDVPTLAEALRNDAVGAEQLRIGSGCVDL